jgi:hypothetical protein
MSGFFALFQLATVKETYRVEYYDVFYDGMKIAMIRFDLLMSQ